jgi:hypothetical protein
MRNITTNSILLMLFIGFTSCQKQDINANQTYPNRDSINEIPYCTDSFERLNDVLATTPFINDFSATEHASLTYKDRDYWKLSVKTRASEKKPTYLNVHIQGASTVRITASISPKNVFTVVHKLGKNTNRRFYIGELTNHQTVTLLFEHLEGETACYDFRFDVFTLESF